MRRRLLEERLGRDETCEPDQGPRQRDENLREVLRFGIDCQELFLDRRLSLDVPEPVPK